MVIERTNTTPRSVEEILAEARKLYDLDPFTVQIPADGSAKAIYDFFRGYTPEEHMQLNEYILSQIDNYGFGQIHRALRITNGYSTNSICDPLNKVASGAKYDSSHIADFEQTGFFSKQYIARIQTVNPLNLSREELKKFHSKWQESGKALHSTQFKYEAQFQTEESLFDEIKSQIAAFKNGELELEFLMALNSAIKDLLAIKSDSQEGASAKIFPDEKQNYLTSILVGNKAINETELNQIAKYLGLTPGQTELLKHLPYQGAYENKYFLEPVRKEMTARKVKNVFYQPEEYEHVGKWIMAMREAAQQTGAEIANFIGVSAGYFAAIENLAGGTNRFPPKHISKVLEQKIYNLPESHLVERYFEHLLMCPNRNEWQKQCREIFIPWKVAREKLTAAMDLGKPIGDNAWHDLYKTIEEDIKNSLAKDKGLDIVFIKLRHRPRMARIHDGEVYLNNGDVVDLCNSLKGNRSFVGRLRAEQLQTQNPLLSDPTPSKL